MGEDIMGEQLMRIINLKIIKLHKYFNYNVDFNNDVTFIYGSNGCGKTTILNITEYIITGNLYRLFEYEFERIVLKYEPIKSIGDIREILIEKNSSNITVNFDGNTEKISRIEGFHGRFPEELDGIYLKQYSILRRIRDSFNYVYLPLNRKTVLYDLFSVRNRNFRSHNHILKNDEEELGKYYFDQAINDVEILIKECYSRTSMMISKINNDFRNKILKSSIEVLSSFDTNEFLKQIASSSSISDIKKTKKSFIKIAREIELLSPNEESIYDKFFQDYIDELMSIKDNKEIGIEIIAKFQDISRFKKIVSMAEEMEMQKEQYLKPIELFLGTINDFIKTADDEKEIKIDEYGNLYFQTIYSSDKISVQNLSSGEKQLVIFFANLIFRVKGNSSGIFVVDEPEISLHLSWQKTFVEKALNINKNIQLIFATHSPELIGKYRNKTFRLVKEYIG